VVYHGPAATDPDYILMRVLDYILLRGDSSRLYRRLVDQEEVATSVDGGHSAHIDPFPFKLAIQPRSGVDPGNVEEVLYDELEKVRTNLVSEPELQKAKNTALADFYRSMKTISGKADLLGTYEVIFGDYRELFKLPEKIAAVSREDVRRIANKYFDPKRRTVGVLIPAQEESEGQPAAASGTRPASQSNEKSPDTQ
jgi:zinc protease